MDQCLSGRVNPISTAMPAISSMKYSCAGRASEVIRMAANHGGHGSPSRSKRLSNRKHCFMTHWIISTEKTTPATRGPVG